MSDVIDATRSEQVSQDFPLADLTEEQHQELDRQIGEVSVQVTLNGLQVESILGFINMAVFVYGVRLNEDEATLLEGAMTILQDGLTPAAKPIYESVAGVSL